MLVEQNNKAGAMSGLQEMQHFVDNHVFEQVFRFLHQFGVQTDVTSSVITASPLGLHALKEIAGNSYAKLWLPPSNQVWHDCVEQRLVPFVNDLSPLGLGAAWANG